MSDPHLLERSARQSAPTSFDGVTRAFGPFDFQIYDPADVAVETREIGAVNWLPATGVTIQKGAADPDYFSIRFDDAQPATHEFRVRGKRVHERSASLYSGKGLSVAALSRELQQSAMVMQEVRRDVNSVNLEEAAEIVFLARQEAQAAQEHASDALEARQGIETARDTAKAYANAPEDTEVEPEPYSSNHYAAKAQKAAGEVAGVTQEVASLVGETEKLKLAAPSIIKTIPENDRYLIIPIEDYLQGNLADIELALYGWLPSINNPEIVFQVSTDGGASWVASTSYTSASLYGASNTTNANTQPNTTTSGRVSYRGTTSSSAKWGTFGHLRIFRDLNLFTIQGQVGEFDETGVLRAWHPNVRIREHTVTHCRFYYGSNALFSGASRYSIKNNLRQV
ncbi:hypothetical protein TRICHSKD4_4510 [Roseibium sp. TrichSKD4]|uniref:hypothetical protein n=1 Tax=Roseibium sp. TrichSKD4 TaxID=744980 RepID=UPI0001E575A3|nr:hypothetical protein [Roseibium sp. TrichSKD4]EFO30910.1 hypothetical protein TRICHSKD4_4510 [Roseibium sp. TrichSKD4]